MLNLQKRLHLSFAIALALVLVTGATSLYYIRQFDRKVHDTLIKDIELAEAGGALNKSLQDVRAAYREYMKVPGDAAMYQVMSQSFENFMTGVQQSQAISQLERNIEIHEEIISDGNELRLVMKETMEKPDARPVFAGQARAFFDSAGKRLETIQDQRREEMASHRMTIDRLFDRAKQNQLLIIIVVLIGGAFLAFFMPRRAVWPFKRILQAFHEAWECNLRVRLPAKGEDELAELSRSFNQMMAQLEEFDEMKVKRIAFERRRFEVLANSLNMGVILVTVEGKVIFINAPAYRVFDVTSTQVVNKELEATPLPPRIIELFQEALTTKQKIEDRRWEAQLKGPSGKEEKHAVSIDILPVRTHAGDLVNLLMLIKESAVPVEERLFQREVSAVPKGE